MKKTGLLKKYILDPKILVMPGAHDALSARIIEKAGFKALFVGGYPATAALMGKLRPKNEGEKIKQTHRRSLPVIASPKDAAISVFLGLPRRCALCKDKLFNGFVLFDSSNE